jgi:hypothetical protein
MVTLRANEEWRNDPKRREQARKLCKLRASLYEKLIKDLEWAQIHFYQLQQAGEEKPSRWTPDVSFLHLIENYKKSHKHYANPTETLIGNMAAFGEM